jgi:hypothetical protein
VSELKPVFVPLDKAVENAVDEMTAVYLSGLIRLSEEAAESNPEDEGASTVDELPSLETDELRSWLIEACAPKDNVAPSFSAYVASVVNSKLMALHSAQLELTVHMQTFLGGTDLRIAEHILLVNAPHVMDVLAENPMHPEGVMLIPIPEAVVDEEADPMKPLDVLMAVVRWEGVYLCRPAIVDLQEVEERLLEASKSHIDAVATKRVPNVYYRQGRPH